MKNGLGKKISRKLSLVIFTIIASWFVLINLTILFELTVQDVGKYHGFIFFNLFTLIVTKLVFDFELLD